MSKEIRVGVIGVGQRGIGMLNHTMDVEDVRITAVCDLYQDRIDNAVKEIEERKGYTPSLCTKDYKDVIASDDVDVVMIFAAWEVHIPICIEAMRAHKPVAVEVAGAYSVEQCWDLVRTYEETKTPIMMLENCCYNRLELMLMNMVDKGVFGELVSLNGAYRHDLRKEIMIGGFEKGRHYRFRNYKNRCCENYPTHELGPIAQMLKINRGNRMVSLVSVASKSAGMHEYIAKNHSDNEEMMNTRFNQGDVVTTIIKCANGETITLTLDTTLPRFYSRDLKIHGTKACYEDASRCIFIDDTGLNHEDGVTKYMNNIDNFTEEYDHSIWKNYEKEGIREGHGGMDWLVINAFFDALKENKPMPIDVYDMASWMSITPLTETSIKTGLPVEIPDFTNGKWVLV